MTHRSHDSRRNFLKFTAGAAGASLGSALIPGFVGNAFAAPATPATPANKALIAAAKAEGKLNVIALPPDWANYGKMIAEFSKLYGIKVNSASPDASSAQELQAIKSLKGQSRGPDVVDVGPAFALAGVEEGLFQHY